jgi:hypothetical protein
MNAFEKLLKLDKGKLDEMPTKEIASKRLTFLLGEGDEVEKVKIRALSSREIEYVTEYTTDSNGDVNQHRLIDGNALVCSKAILEPNVRDEELISHFGARNAQDLCEKIFQMEMAAIASEVMELSGVGVNENDVKN